MRSYDPGTSEWTLSYFLTDHLGSMLAVTDVIGTIVSEQRYLPFGAVREDESTITQTDLGYTGQRDLPDMGLIDYRARFYSPTVMRFVQPDSMVPNPLDPQSLSRFSYVLQNPLRYTDPAGHYCVERDVDGIPVAGGCWGRESIDEELSRYGTRLKDAQDEKHKRAVLIAVRSVGARLAAERGYDETAAAAFKAVWGYLDITLDPSCYDCRTPKQIRDCGHNVTREGCVPGGGLTTGAHSITFASMSGENSDDIFRMARNVVHELGHAYDNLLGQAPRNDMPGWIVEKRDLILRKNDPCGACWAWQQNRIKSPSETFADMFIAWTYDVWNPYPENAETVSDAQSWMDMWMP